MANVGDAARDVTMESRMSQRWFGTSKSGIRSPSPVILEVLPHTANHESHGVTFGAGLGHPGTGDCHHLGLRLHP